MKMKTNHPMNPATRFGLSLILAIALTSTVSCGKRESESWLGFGKKETITESAIRTLDMKFEDLKAQVTGKKTHSEKAVATWQAVSAVFIVLSGFALIFGAALGSQARKVRVSKATSAPTSNS